MEIDRIYSSLDRIEAKLDSQSKDISEFQERVAKLEERVAGIKGSIKIILTLLISAFTYLAGWFLKPLINQ